MHVMDVRSLAPVASGDGRLQHLVFAAGSLLPSQQEPGCCPGRLCEGGLPCMKD